MAVREVEEVRLYNHHPDKAYRCSQTIEAQLPPGKRPRIVVCLTPEDVVQGADIVVTATDSHTPVFPPGLVEPGMHVNAIGSFRPTMQELPPGVISPSAKVAVESRQVALEETGDLVIPVRDGLFRPEDIYAELGEIAAGKKPGRVSADEVTVFKLVGLAAMDVVVGAGHLRPGGGDGDGPGSGPGAARPTVGGSFLQLSRARRFTHYETRNPSGEAGSRPSLIWHDRCKESLGVCVPAVGWNTREI